MLLERQAESLGLPLRVVKLPKTVSNDEYEKIMAAEMESFKARGVTGVAFADLFLADLKKYREDKLAQAGLRGIFPLWMRDTRELARRFIAMGFRP